MAAVIGIVISGLLILAAYGLGYADGKLQVQQTESFRRLDSLIAALKKETL